MQRPRIELSDRVGKCHTIPKGTELWGLLARCKKGETDHRSVRNGEKAISAPKPTTEKEVIPTSMTEHGGEDSKAITRQAVGGKRYIEIWESSVNDYANEKSELVTIHGGDWGTKMSDTCHPFNSADVRGCSIQAGYGCHAYIRKGGCHAEGHLSQVDNLGGCTPVPFGGAGVWWSLMIICSLGTKDWPTDRLIRNSVAKRGDGAFSDKTIERPAQNSVIKRVESADDQRWVKYWLTYNDQCQVSPEDSGVIASGNIGDLLSVQCQTRNVLTNPVSPFVQEEHGCQLYIQLGDCDHTGSLPQYLPIEQCTQVSPEWELSVWSLRAICNGGNSDGSVKTIEQPTPDPMAKRDDGANDARWVTYWLTYTDQCGLKLADSGTNYSGNMETTIPRHASSAVYWSIQSGSSFQT